MASAALLRSTNWISARGAFFDEQKPDCLATAAIVAALASPAFAQSENSGRRILTVAFSAGLNTAEPGNAANRHIVPKVIKVKPGDVVNFVVSGHHPIRVYADGVRLDEMKAQIPDACEVNPVPSLPECDGVPVAQAPPGNLATSYVGITPVLSAQPGSPFALPKPATNRAEPISFLKPGRYLVICTVLSHFNDKMHAFVEVPKGKPDVGDICGGGDGGDGGGDGGGGDDDGSLGDDEQGQRDRTDGRRRS